MLRVSADCDCGVLSLFDLAYHSPGSPAKSKEIAHRQTLSKGYVEQVFQKLKRAHLVKSDRGPTGGYSLAKSYDGISIGDIIRAVDGPIELVFCVGDSDKPGLSCERIHACVTRGVWMAGSGVLMRFFDSVTLVDLCDKAREQGIQSASEQELMYYI